MQIASQPAKRGAWHEFPSAPEAWLSSACSMRAPGLSSASPLFAASRAQEPTLPRAHSLPLLGHRGCHCPWLLLSLPRFCRNMAAFCRPTSGLAWTPRSAPCLAIRPIQSIPDIRPSRTPPCHSTYLEHRRQDPSIGRSAPKVARPTTEPRNGQLPPRMC